MQEDSNYNFKCYIELQRIDIEKYKRELSRKIGKKISEEEAFQLWIESGRAKEFHDYFMREHLNEDNGSLKKLIEEESAELNKH